MARTAGSPPPDSRTRRAMARATATSAVASTALKAIRKKRAPTTVTPAVGWTRGRPEVRRPGGIGQLGRRSPSKPPRRMSASRRPLRHAAPPAHRGRPGGRSARATSAPSRSAAATAAAMGVSAQGDERRDVDRPHPRVDPLMPGEVDLGERRLVEGEEPLRGAPPARRPGSAPSGCGRDRTRRRAAAPPATDDAAASQPRHHLRAPALADVGDAFERRHGRQSIAMPRLCAGNDPC